MESPPPTQQMKIQVQISWVGQSTMLGIIFCFSKIFFLLFDIPNHLIELCWEESKPSERQRCPQGTRFFVQSFQRNVRTFNLLTLISYHDSLWTKPFVLTDEPTDDLKPSQVKLIICRIERQNYKNSLSKFESLIWTKTFCDRLPCLPKGVQE